MPPQDPTIPQTPPAPQQPAAAPQQPALDPNVVALEQSIRHVESNDNYTAPGKSGEYGAYQFEPGTWDEAAPAAGVNVPLDQANPEQQNEVAYKTLASWKQQHPDWNIGNYASAWNAGIHNPDAYADDNVGENSHGVGYNTPEYAQQVADTYQKIKDGSFTPPTAASLAQIGSTTPPASSPGLSTWEKVALGIGGAGVIGGLSFLTGGLDLPFLGALGLGADAAEGAGAAAGAGEAAAGAGMAAEGGGAISAIKSAVAPVVGAGEAYEAGKGLFGGGQQPTAPSAVQTPPIQPLSDQTYPQSSQANQALLQAQQSALGATATGRVFAQSPEAQGGMQANAKYGTLPTVDENGNFDSTAATEKGWNMVNELSGSTSKALDAEGSYGNINDMAADAKANMRQHTPMHDWESAESDIDALTASAKPLADERGNIPLGTMEKIRKEHGRASRFDIKNPITSSKRAAHKALYFGARREIEKKTESKELYNLAMKEEQGILNGMKVNKRLNGKKVPVPNGVGKQVAEKIAQYAAIAIGDKIGGPLGAVVGAVVGHHLDKTIEKKFGKNLLETKSVKKAMEMVAQKRPEVAKLLQGAIAKYGNRQAAEKEYSIIKKEPKSEVSNDEKEMGLYQLGKDKSTGRVGLTGFHEAWAWGRRYHGA